MSDFIAGFGEISDFIQSIVFVPRAFGSLVRDVPYLSFALGLSVTLGFLTWFIKAALRG